MRDRGKGRSDAGKIRVNASRRSRLMQAATAVFNSRRDNVDLSNGTSDGKLPSDSIW